MGSRISVFAIGPAFPAIATMAGHIIGDILADPIPRVSEDRAEPMPP